MPFEDIQQQTDAIGGLAGMPQAQGMEGAGGAGGVQGMGGPGVDTPQEQQAVQLLMQGAQMLRQAAQVDPSIRPIIDKLLPDAFLQITQHYGFAEEGKMALKQAQMQQGRARASAVGGMGPTQGPPTGPPTGPPGPRQPGPQDITY